MKSLVLVAVLLMTHSGAALAFECPYGEEGHLEPVRWSAKAGGGTVTVGLGVTNGTDKAIRMVDAAVWFEDGLGRTITGAGLDLDPDLQLAAGGSVITYVQSPSAQRMVEAKFEDFTAHICARALLFADGSKSEF